MIFLFTKSAVKPTKSRFRIHLGNRSFIFPSQFLSDVADFHTASDS